MTSALAKELSVLQTLPTQLQAIQFPRYSSIQAKTDDEELKESLIELEAIATQYLRSMASKTWTYKTSGLYDKDGKFYIGDSEVVIGLASDDIIIDNETYRDGHETF